MKQPEPRIDRARVVALLERFGGDPARFPETERRAAAALIAQDPELSALQREASELDDMLGALETPVPSAALRRAVAEIPLRHVREPGRSVGLLELFGAGLMGRLRFAASFLVALGAGLAAGRMAPATEGGGDAPEQTLELAAGDAASPSDPDSAWEEFAALAFADSLTLEDGSDDGWGDGTGPREAL